MSSWQKYQRYVVRELHTATLWRDCLAEAIATFFLMSVQAACPLGFGNQTDRALLIALTMGFVVLVLIEAFGEFGGAHMNPAVSIAMALTTKLTITRMMFYIIAQCGGAIAGAGFVYAMTPPQYHEKLSGTSVNPEVALWQGVIVEAWLTGLLVIVIFGSTNRERRQLFMPAIPIGLTVALDIMTGINYTGSSMNPARSLGPAVVLGEYDHLWVYWVGPIMGGIVAAGVYSALNSVGKMPRPEALNLKQFGDILVNDTSFSKSEEASVKSDATNTEL